MPQSIESFDFLSGGGEMGRRIREYDWAGHPLGRTNAWPQSLKTAVSLILNSRHPMWIGWETEMWFLYNDAYLHVLGMAKHPKSLGRPAAEVWAEIWDVCGPLADKVFREGQASFVDDVRLFMHRGDHLEETYYSFSYSPIRDESGGVGGLFCPSTDTTAKVLSGRRLRTLSDLASGVYVGATTESACATIAAELSKNPDDIPFAFLYVTNRPGTQAVLVETVRVGREDQMWAPAVVDLAAGSEGCSVWPLSAVLSRGASQRVHLEQFDALPLGPANQRVSEAIVLPVLSHGDDKPLGVLIAGWSPTRRSDPAYQTFFELVARQVGTTIQNARIVEEEKKRAEMLEEIDRAKTAFFSNVSHEFRTPLTLMIGPLEDALEGEPLSRVQRERIDLAHRNSLRLLKLVNSLLDFSRIEAGRAQAVYQPTDIAALTAELASNFRSACERAGLKLIVDCPALPEPVYVDRDMWEKIVLNLLSNAFKFSFDGEIAVSLRLIQGHAELSVRDTGVGVPSQELPRLFERFHRVAGQQSRSFEGSGIGLALVQELVKLHGGTISVESSVGCGTTFTIRVPLGTIHLPEGRIEGSERVDQSATGAKAYVEEALHWLAEDIQTKDVSSRVAENHDAPAPFQGARILLADDNSDMRDYVSRLLGDKYEIEVVSDGQEALQAARLRPPDLILSDVMMPRMDGFGLLRALRLDRLLNEVPVIMLSARAGEESRVEGLQAGADDYLVKPFSARELIARVGSMLELSRVRRAAVTAVRESEKRIRAMFQQAPSFISILRGPEHVFEFANDAYMRLIGERRDIIGKPIREALPEITGQGYFELLDEVFLSGKPFTGLENSVQLQRSPHGPLLNIVLDFIYQPITDSSGQVTGIFVEGFEVTERVKAQGALRESEERYRTLFDSIDEGFCIIEAIPANGDTLADFRYIAVNPALEAQSGVPARVGDTIRAVIPTEAQTWIDVFDNILRTGIPIRGERGLLSQGRVLDLYSFRLEDDTKRRVGVIFTDVTSRKRAEAALLRANEDLEQFAYSASHDLQEPLRTVKIYSELLSQRYGEKLTGDAKQFLDFVTAGATRMEMLVRDLLSYTQATQRDRHSVAVDAGDALASALANLSESIKESNAEVSFGPLPSLPIHPTQLQQIFQNLVGNAIKYRRQEVSPVINIQAQLDGGCWQFSVSDNGIGIESEYKERVFGLFKRLHTGDKYSGTGIGLAICQRIVEKYHGRIWVESEIGKGSTFYFILPASYFSLPA
jgi:signal transduction histidine kinase/DNA-binding NarL/FixJ family response regulator